MAAHIPHISEIDFTGLVLHEVPEKEYSRWTVAERTRIAKKGKNAGKEVPVEYKYTIGRVRFFPQMKFANDNHFSISVFHDGENGKIVQDKLTECYNSIVDNLIANAKANPRKNRYYRGIDKAHLDNPRDPAAAAIIGKALVGSPIYIGEDNDDSDADDDDDAPKRKPVVKKFNSPSTIMEVKLPDLHNPLAPRNHFAVEMWEFYRDKKGRIAKDERRVPNDQIVKRIDDGRPHEAIIECTSNSFTSSKAGEKLVRYKPVVTKIILLDALAEPVVKVNKSVEAIRTALATAVLDFAITVDSLMDKGGDDDSEVEDEADDGEAENNDSDDDEAPQEMPKTFGSAAELSAKEKRKFVSKQE